jgi:hypothetical protein
MKRSVATVSVYYNNVRCADVYFLPGETAGEVREEFLEHHLLTSISLRNEDKVELGESERLVPLVKYEMICGCGRLG